MSAARAPRVTPLTPDRTTLLRKISKDTPPAEDIARLLTDGIASNTVALRRWAQHAIPEEQIDVTALHGAMEEAGARVRRNDLGEGEAMLMAQAITLNAMFSNLAMKAHGNTTFEQYQVNLRLALRVQSNCRATLETLAAMKNPPVFARQANVAQGGQVVNNGTIHGAARAELSDAAPTKLLEGERNGKRLDGGAQGEAAGGDSPLATVDTLDRAPHGGRQGPCVPQRVPRRRTAEAPCLGARASDTALFMLGR